MKDLIITYVICLTAPVFYLVMGAIFKKSKGGKINNIFGYRSHLSLKNETMWAYANYIYGQLFWVTGLAEGLIAFAVITILYAVISSVDGDICMLILAVQLLSHFAIVFAVEKKLKKADAQG